MIPFSILSSTSLRSLVVVFEQRKRKPSLLVMVPESRICIFNKTGGADIGVTATTTSITFDDVMDLYYSLRAPYRNKANWLLNDSTVKAIRKPKDGNGNYI